MPPKTLSKLYERNSLRNTEQGFEFAFKNTVAPSTLTTIGPLIVDNAPYDLEKVTVRLERPSERPGRPPSVREWQVEVVNKGKDRLLAFDLYTVAYVVVAGPPLPPGPHQVALHVNTKEVGEIILTAEDNVAE